MFKYPNLQAEQAKKRMSNREVAAYLGLSRNSYEQKKRSGRFIPEEVKKLLTLFNCKFDYLFESEEIKKSS